jgi:meiotically up-regulated gene 157 (Mug157) protein
MPSRERVLTLAAALLALGGAAVHGAIPPVRPPIGERKFVSPVIDAVINRTAARMRDPDLATLFSNCYPNTLDTTVMHFSVSPSGVPDTFVVTGDISAQWLRDSTNQLLPYLAFASQDRNLQLLVCGLIHRQSRDVLNDSFANSFNFADEGGPWQSDERKPPMNPHIFEGKYELDSLAAVLKLSWNYFVATNDTSCFDATWKQAMARIVSTIVLEQRGSEEEGEDPPYTFQRTTPVATDTLMLGGRGPMAARTNMSKCAFRPSDDATTLPFLVPANAMAAVELAHLSTLLQALDDPGVLPLAQDAAALSSQIHDGLMRFALDSETGTRFAYEVDGFGSQFFMDDANVPSLLSLPYLGFLNQSDPLYLATRAFVLSNANPYFFRGSAGEGIGGPHVGMGYIWPMSIIMRVGCRACWPPFSPRPSHAARARQALTSDDDSEIETALATLKASSAGTGLMHESFWRDDVAKYTRAWFAWCNGLFGELILTLAEERPWIIFSDAQPPPMPPPPSAARRALRPGRRLRYRAAIIRLGA